MTDRKAATPERWRDNPYCRTFLEYVAWVCAIEAMIVVGWIAPFGKLTPVREYVLLLGLFLLLFALPLALVSGSGALVRLAFRRRPAPGFATVGGVLVPPFYWPSEHFVQAFLSVVAVTVAMSFNMATRPPRQHYLMAFPWCIEGLTLLGIAALRIGAFSLCFRSDRTGTWAAATWRHGSWDRLGDLLIAASLTFLVLIYLFLHFFGGSRQGFVEFCVLIMAVSLVPLGLMLMGRGVRLMWRWWRKGGEASQFAP